MNPTDIGSLVEKWSALGFEPTENRDGNPVWKDFCVIESLFGGPTLPCDWIEISNDGSSAHMKGSEPGEIKTRECFT
ncbi:MAG: hypothetical protein JNK92_11825 [Dechloromonas sp.]|nr:hypothetical protein [Dechloromonas sp.]